LHSVKGLRRNQRELLVRLSHIKVCENVGAGVEPALLVDQFEIRPHEAKIVNDFGWAGRQVRSREWRRHRPLLPLARQHGFALPYRKRVVLPLF